MSSCSLHEPYGANVCLMILVSSFNFRTLLACMSLLSPTFMQQHFFFIFVVYCYGGFMNLVDNVNSDHFRDETFVSLVASTEIRVLTIYTKLVLKSGYIITVWVSQVSLRTCSLIGFGVCQSCGFCTWQKILALFHNVKVHILDCHWNYIGN